MSQYSQRWIDNKTLWFELCSITQEILKSKANAAQEELRNVEATLQLMPRSSRHKDPLLSRKDELVAIISLSFLAECFVTEETKC